MAKRESQDDEPQTVYLAACSGRRSELQSAAAMLDADGIGVVSSWLEDKEAGTARSESAAASVAARNLEDVERCDVFVAFSEAADSSLRGRGGRHVELGFALTLGKRILLVGPPEHVFHFLPAVERHDNWSSAHKALRG